MFRHSALVLFFIAAIVIPGCLDLPGSSPENALEERVAALEEQNNLLAEQVRIENQSAQNFAAQLALCRERSRELEAALPGSGFDSVASATLLAPAIIQRVETEGTGPFSAGRVVEEGAMVNCSIEIVPGRGRILVQTTPLMGVVFQEAANTAIGVARSRTGVNITGRDVIFSIRAESEVPAIDGPSAGALMTVLAIAAIEGWEPDADVTLTGTIDADGRIGEVGGVVEKSRAAKISGERVILLPLENAQSVRYVEVRRQYYGFEVVERRPEIVDAKEYIEENIAIDVEYVETIDDALRYFRPETTIPAGE